MSRYAYLTDAKTFVKQFDGERWVSVSTEFRDKCLSAIAEHDPLVVLIWHIKYAEFYLDESGITPSSPNNWEVDELCSCTHDVYESITRPDYHDACGKPIRHK